MDANKATNPFCGQIADENQTCERCGKFGALDWGGAFLCPECSEISGSCCPEFGADDRWQDREKD